MAENDADTEEPQASENGAGGGDHLKPKGRRLSFGKVRRELNDDEIASPGVQKMLLDELDRMDGSEAELKIVTEKFNNVNTELAIANQRLKTHNGFDIMSTGFIAVGPLIIGFAFNISGNDTSRNALYVLGGLLIFVGIVVKALRA